MARLEKVANDDEGTIKSNDISKQQQPSPMKIYKKKTFHFYRVRKKSSKMKV